MSKGLQTRNPILNKVKVMSSQDYNNNRKNLTLIGTIRKGHSAFITTQRNQKTGLCSYVADTSVLTKKTKRDVVKFFSDYNNNGKSVAYLAVDNIAKTKQKNKI